MPFRDYTPDPLSANWSYDSAIDLFSLNSMMPEQFPLDLPNELVWDPKDIPADFFAPPPEINGFTVSNPDDLSSDQESDDQSLFATQSHSPIDSLSPPPFFQQQQQQPPKPLQIQTQPQTQTQATTPTTRRYSSSPELASPQEIQIQLQPATSTSTSTSTSKPTRGTPNGSGSGKAPRKIPRSLSDDSVRGRNAAKRAAHNIIEKRYRTNMNAKFVALEKAMGGSGVSKPMGSPKSPVSSSASLKKSEILTNAITYMQELQEANEKLRKELALVNQNLQVSGGLCRAFPR